MERLLMRALFICAWQELDLSVIDFLRCIDLR